MPAATYGTAVNDLLRATRRLPPDQFERAVAGAAAHLGGLDARVLLNDFEQRHLVSTSGGEAVAIADTPAGEAYRTDRPVAEQTDDGSWWWLPLRAGAERLGVLGICVEADAGGTTEELWVAFASVAAHLLATAGRHTDSMFETRRSERMALAAEMQWRLLPPLSFSLPTVALAGMLEPAYAVGGDAFDYTYDDDVLHVGIFDAMGHGVQSALTSTLTVAAYRHARRLGTEFSETFALIDRELVDHRPSSFSTGVLAELDTTTGMLRWINAGHPSPWLLRDGRAGALLVVPALPFGLSDVLPIGEVPPAGQAQLQPGDRILFFSDGILDNGDITDATAAELAIELGRGHGVTETIRLLTHRMLASVGGELRDDATLLLVEYRGPQLAG